VLFNTHSDLEGKHAFLSPSNHHWLNYDQQKLEARFWSFHSAKRGTDLHDLAHTAIKLGVYLDPVHLAMAAYVADAIEYKMKCEQSLYYSENAFGTADTISFTDYVLRVHDLKTGVTPVKFTQLKIYAALFCLEYGFNPQDIQIELRIYQGENVDVYTPEADEILAVMQRIVEADSHIQSLKEEDR
jgi:hypothetical protein